MSEWKPAPLIVGMNPDGTPIMVDSWAGRDELRRQWELMHNGKPTGVAQAAATAADVTRANDALGSE